jgi:serine/threonine-protein kinase RsbW
VTDMDQREPAIAASPLRHDEIEIRMLASRERAPGLRFLAADMAMREDYDLDAIDDLRLAVDEICAITLANATPDTVMTVRLLISQHRIEIGASIPLHTEGEPKVGPLSLRILRSLSDTFDCTTAGSDGERMLNLTFVKSPATAAST